jgi:uncharacterized membrane protein (UPF0127 family)
MKNTKWIAGVIIGGLGLVLFFINPIPNPSQREGNQTTASPGAKSSPFGKDLGGDSTNPNLTKSPTKKLMLKNTTIDLLVAETLDETMWGLSDFPSLPADTGMLFVFPQPGIYSFWMKDMQFSLDMIWIDSDNRVITIHENISPDTYLQKPPQTFQSTKPASAVIEVSGGFVKDYGVKVGERLEIINKI